jgi:hypothetical protein
MLSLVINRIKTIIPKELPKRLGRWNIDYCNKKIDQKIDLSNEDHCGPCGQYIISKSTKTLNDKIIESVKN